MQSFFSSAFAAPVNVDVYLTATGDRRYRDVVAAGTGLPQRQFIYSTGDDIVGDVKVGVAGGRRLEHLGVKIELKGVVDISSDKGGHSHEFVSVVRELAAPGSLTGLQVRPRARARVHGCVAAARTLRRGVVSRLHAHGHPRPAGCRAARGL